MGIKGEDLRVIRTRALLCQALEKLLKIRSIKKISINDICDEAMVNRSTFYKHFDDKYDFLEYYISQASESVYQIAKNKIFDDSSDVTTVDIIREISRYDVILYNILDADKDNTPVSDFLTQAVVDYFCKKISDWQPMLKPNQSFKVLSQFYAGGILTVTTNWIKEKDNPNRMTEEELSEQINLLFSTMMINIHKIVDVATKETD